MSSKGKPAFHPEMVSKKVSPLHTSTTDFDYDAVERALGNLPETDDDFRAEFVARIFSWVTNCNAKGQKRMTLVGRRFIALAWVMNPGLFEGQSANQLALSLGIKPNSVKVLFNQLCGEASREFGISNSAQRHAWNRGTGAPQTRPNGLGRVEATNSMAATKAAQSPAGKAQGAEGGPGFKESFNQPAKPAGGESAPKSRTPAKNSRFP